MAEYRGRARRTSSNMPPYRAVLAVDVEKYSRTTSAQQQLLSNTVRDALEQAFADSGLEEVWRTASFPQSTGDGYLVGVPTEYLPRLIHPLLPELQDVLDDMQPALASEDRSLRLRLRAAIGLGPLPDTGGEERGDGIGTAMNETHRVLDSPALKKALAESDPDITFLAAGLTRRAYEDAVLGGYVAVKQRLFRGVTVDLPDKEYRAESYIYVPQPSINPGGPAPEGPGESAAPAGNGSGGPPAPADAAAGAPRTRRRSAPVGAAAEVANSVGGDSKNTFQARTVHGDVYNGDTRTSVQHGGIGPIGGDVGTAVAGTRGPVNIGGTQYNDFPDQDPEEEA
ncbi:hypothetical protein J0910_13615 [Nocardiopsis sp. CNT-189]|uniref:hypothetical protein n=1 Tax=Nocardiopsis oceanisediminis TaxID=2816862 RepID=UPI003B2A0468